MATSLYNAFSAAKDWAREKMRYSGTLRYMLPWLPDDVQEIDDVFGGDCWPYGVEPNRPTLEALVHLHGRAGFDPGAYSDRETVRADVRLSREKIREETMRVLITGGMGVIGAEASRKFVREGHRPVLYSRHRDESLIRDIVDKVDIELGYILDRARLAEVIKSRDITHVVHTAAYVSALSAKHPAESVEINVMGTVNVLEAARAANVERVVYTSAKGIYGPFLGDIRLAALQADHRGSSEGPEAHLRFRQAHGRERDALLGHARPRRGGAAFRHDLRPRQDRAPRQYGRDQPDRRAAGQRPAVPHRVKAAMRRTISSTTRIRRSAFISPRRRKASTSRVYNIGSGVGVTLKDVAADLAQTLAERRDQDRAGTEFPRHAVSAARRLRHFARARKELGYKPEYDLERGVADYLESLQAAEAASRVDGDKTMRNVLELPRLRCASATAAGPRAARRWTARDLDCLVLWGWPLMWDFCTANARYLCPVGGNAEFNVLVFPRNGDPTCFVLMPTFLEGWRSAQDWVGRHPRPQGHWADTVAERLKELRLDRGRIGMDGLAGPLDPDGWLPHSVYLRLQELLPGAKLVNLDDMLEKVRTIKSEEELGILAKAARARRPDAGERAATPRGPASRNARSTAA